MNILVDAILIFISFVLHSILFPTISIADITPNIFIILVSSIGFMRGDKEGMLVGFFSGMLLDIFFGPVLGINAFLFTLIGFLNGKFCGFFFPEEIKLPAGLILLSDFTYSIVIYIFLFLFRGRFQFGLYLGEIIIGELIYTFIVAVFIYPLLLLINMLLEKFHSEEIDR